MMASRLVKRKAKNYMRQQNGFVKTNQVNGKEFSFKKELNLKVIVYWPKETGTEEAFYTD